MTTYALTSQTFKGWHGTTGQGNTPDVVTLRDNVNTLAATIASDRDTDVASVTTHTSQIALLQVNTLRIPLTLTANGTWATYAAVPGAATITSIKLITPTVFASTGGTVLLTCKKTSSGGNTILTAATYDLEAAGADTSVGLTLTATGADKAVAANGLIYIAVVSNNADATGPDAAAGCLHINYTLDLA